MKNIMRGCSKLTLRVSALLSQFTIFYLYNYVLSQIIFLSYVRYEQPTVE